MKRNIKKENQIIKQIKNDCYEISITEMSHINDFLATMSLSVLPSKFDPIKAYLDECATVDSWNTDKYLVKAIKGKLAKAIDSWNFKPYCNGYYMV